MTSISISGPARHRRSGRTVAAAAIVAAVLLTGTACTVGHHTSSLSPTPPSTTAPTTIGRSAPTEVGLLNDILGAHRRAGEFVGARLALRDANGAITEATTGTSTTQGASPPVDMTVPWNIGSVTKTFVAVVVLQLAQEGRLDLDAGITPFFPDLPGADRITPRQLLQHTSGLGEYIDQPAVTNDPTRHWGPEELIAVAEAGGRASAPGDGHHYANTNYIVLGQIIEQITGHSWADEVRSRIVEPLGLAHTGPVGDHRATGYKLVDGSLVDATYTADPSIGGAAGALESDGHDLLVFITALADGRLLSPASQAAMQAFVPGEDYSQYGIDHGYGLGLERYATGAITMIGHMGTGEGHTAYVGYDPEHRTTIAVMTNTAIAGPAAIMAVEALTALAHPD